MSTGYLLRALNELASLTRVIRRDGCDAQMRQKAKPLQNKKTNPERQKLRRISNH